MMERKAALLLTVVMMAAFGFLAGSRAYAEDAVSPAAAAVETELGEATEEPTEEPADVSAGDGPDLPDENAGTVADAAWEEDDARSMEAGAQPAMSMEDEMTALETAQDIPAEEDMLAAPVMAGGDVIVRDIEVMAEIPTAKAAAASGNVTPITIGRMVSVSFSGDDIDECVCYSFTPAESGCYTIVSYAKTFDPDVYLFDESYDINDGTDGDSLAYDDDNDSNEAAPNYYNNNCNFMLTYKNFIAGKKYYYVIHQSSPNDDEEPSFSVCVYKTDTDGHCWGSWTTASVQGQTVRTRTCAICNKTETQNFIPVLALTANKLTMKTKQTTSKFKVAAMAEGDALASVTSSNTKLLKVSNVNPNGTFKLKAQGKTGTAKLTVTLRSGLSKTIKVKIQKSKIRTTKIKVSSKKLTLKKKQKHKLTTVVTPVTSYDKVTYSTSNKKVATVSKKGQITAKSKGKATITVRSGKKSVKVKVTVK